MRPEDAFIVEGEVTDVVSDRSARVALRNGHCLFAHATRRSGVQVSTLRPGRRVRVRLSPYDMSKGVFVEMEGI